MPKTERWQWYVEEFAPSEQHHHAIEELFVATRSEYQQVAVLRSPVFGKMLVLDGDTQSSQADERIYHEALVHPALAAAEDRSDVLIVGGGEGATLREALRCPDVRRCTMVDIDGLVVELARKYLAEWSAGAFDDARANVVVGDALEYLRSHDERYGTIVSDLTEPLEDSPSNPLFNDDVFALIKSHVLDGGVYVLQASTAAVHNASLHCKMARTLRRHYRHVASFSTHVPAFDTEWAFLACSDRVDVARLDRARIAEYCSRLSGESFFYDAITHRRLFSLPLYLRRMLDAGGDTF
ncbi:MAG: spermidine synthase [Candidatus Eremiobacteraeota bacterium]|nr:spermidine synthase [Candidatus Eremiobacteraeota bacterium]MBV9698833.1 spermidine synthase [Candidatus Eremiobacteraeota bacterium]